MLCSSCSHEVKPVIAFDIDGTLTMYHEDLASFASKYWSQRPIETLIGYDGSVKLAEWFGVSDAEYRAMKLAFRQGGNKRFMNLYPGALDMLTTAYNLGAEVWFTTTRPYLRHDTVDPDTRHWLGRIGVPMETLRVLYDEDKYARLIEIVDKDRVVMVVEDLTVNVTRGRELGLPVIQIARLHNRADRVADALDTMAIVAAMPGTIEQWKEKHEQC